MNRLGTFVLLLAATFFVPWLCLIALPYVKLKDLHPQQFDAEDPAAGEFPVARPNTAKAGHGVYGSEGCVQCHSQVIRPTYAGVDAFTRGYGKVQDNEAPVHTRESVPGDYYGEDYAYIGIQRNGPDLANVGYRFSEAEFHAILYNPRHHHPHAVMPSFRHLYQVRKIQGEGSRNAVETSGKLAPPPGMEIVPSDAANDLVAYLMTLKKDAPTAAPPKAPAEKPAPAATAAAK